MDRPDEKGHKSGPEHGVKQLTKAFAKVLGKDFVL